MLNYISKPTVRRVIRDRIVDLRSISTIIDFIRVVVRNVNLKDDSSLVMVKVRVEISTIYL